MNGITQKIVYTLLGCTVISAEILWLFTANLRTVEDVLISSSSICVLRTVVTAERKKKRFTGISWIMSYYILHSNVIIKRQSQVLTTVLNLFNITYEKVGAKYCQGLFLSN